MREITFWLIAFIDCISHVLLMQRLVPPFPEHALIAEEAHAAKESARVADADQRRGSLARLKLG
jgi:hypothetical protein